MDFADDEAQPKILEIKNDLERWAAELPACLQPININPEQKSFRGAVHLHMNYNQILVYMGRAALLRRVQAHLHRIRDEERGNITPTESSESTARDLAEERLSRSASQPRSASSTTSGSFTRWAGWRGFPSPTSTVAPQRQSSS